MKSKGVTGELPLERILEEVANQSDREQRKGKRKGWLVRELKKGHLGADLRGVAIYLDFQCSQGVRGAGLVCPIFRGKNGGLGTDFARSKAEHLPSVSGQVNRGYHKNDGVGKGGKL